jgi:hypothetical protein
VHFHFTGFAIPLMAGELVRYRHNSASRWLLIAVIVGVPAVALGITTTQLGGPREIEFLAASLMAIAGICLGVGNLRIAWRLPRVAGVLLAISGASLIVALGWSILYASGQYGLIVRLDVPFMVHWHGIINAVGAILCGLFGWHLLLTSASGVSAHAHIKV